MICRNMIVGKMCGKEISEEEIEKWNEWEDIVIKEGNSFLSEAFFVNFIDKWFYKDEGICNKCGKELIKEELEEALNILKVIEV